MKKILGKLKMRRSRPTSTVSTPEDTPIKPQSEAQQTKNQPRQTIRKNSRIEDLPPEIRVQLLASMELNELHGLVHASPVFHESYLEYRNSILRSSVIESLRNNVVDAIAVSRALDEKDRLQKYKNNMEKGAAALDSVSEHRLHQIAVFYRNTIAPLIPAYSNWALANLPDEVKDRPEAKVPLTRSEQQRITRALYRWELYCRIFGRGSLSDTSPKRHDVPQHKVLRDYFCMFNPWETEEIMCLFYFITETYKEVSMEIQNDFRPVTPPIVMRPSTPDPTVMRPQTPPFDFTPFDLADGTATRGLDLFGRVLTLRDQPDGLIPFLRPHIVHPVWKKTNIWQMYLDEDPFYDERIFYRRMQRHPNEHDEMTERSDPLPFIGDDLDASGPPLAWTIMWGDTYSNLFGSFIPDKMKNWGYIFWDAWRLTKLAVDDGEMLAWQWESSHTMDLRVQALWNVDPEAADW
ncbi:hypothetical protein M011DRAFT_467653 [Sporormia fimetaria CBS 119925]|uniref:F-box domain-containing protein n=1 Tax=Sporormia fimetaria CBS 119925 TaxID=1340428 RepID=A0A6A6VAF4_9PLEO|nr:hypothetical protein M011DRAFT_467653 [Sporormia fimetaria CBS 119925]